MAGPLSVGRIALCMLLCLLLALLLCLPSAFVGHRAALVHFGMHALLLLSLLFEPLSSVGLPW